MCVNVNGIWTLMALADNVSLMFLQQLHKLLFIIKYGSTYIIVRKCIWVSKFKINSNSIGTTIMTFLFELIILMTLVWYV